ncbi:hypothetical protein N7539_004931 [Penicillium diatomitis]|uniref:Uncharacterized protein n=1 Tax=Penicillium diatomitis TaxID=2819901 RepID=A0A9W9X5Y6_9EURO|nr:uncharacterized protein N7539_004931 [Penicillium diatomitis]KAJ5484943.1 hypothetical protein N7539_004931 [Penicillium diatomitis]
MILGNRTRELIFYPRSREIIVAEWKCLRDQESTEMGNATKNPKEVIALLAQLTRPEDQPSAVQSLLASSTKRLRWASENI